MSIQLTAPQRHVVALLAACKPLPLVAPACGVSEAPFMGRGHPCPPATDASATALNSAAGENDYESEARCTRQNKDFSITPTKLDSEKINTNKWKQATPQNPLIYGHSVTLSHLVGPLKTGKIRKRRFLPMAAGKEHVRFLITRAPPLTLSL
jgi:hypothetical protein